jgi:hypothetical protein
MGQQVCLMNPKNSKQMVAVGFVNKFGGIDTFHFRPIPDAWLKVDVKDVTTPNAALIYPNEDVEQHQLKDVLGGNTLWDERFIKRAQLGGRGGSVGFMVDHLFHLLQQCFPVLCSHMTGFCITFFLNCKDMHILQTTSLQLVENFSRRNVQLNNGFSRIREPQSRAKKI